MSFGTCCFFAALFALCSCARNPAPQPPNSKLDFAGAKNRLFIRGDLEKFYRRLERLEPGAKNEREVVRVLMFGDSIIWGDCLTIRLKRRFQADFGDGGRGLLNIVDEPATRLLDHVNLTRGGWTRFKIPYESFTLPALPNLGFTGFSYRPFPAAATTHAVGPRSPVQGLYGWRRRARFAIPELGPPKHAKQGTNGESWRRLRLVLRSAGSDGATTARIHALTEQGENKRIQKDIALSAGGCSPVEIDLPPVRRLSLRFQGALPFVDAMAVETERGVSFSPVILRGLHQTWLLGVPERQFACGYEHYAPDLVIFQFGINESHSMLFGSGGFTAERYERQLREFYLRLREAAPRTSILILGPFERMIRYRTYPAHAKAREIQKRIALELNLAFFDGFRFMGGTQGFIQKARAGLVQSDFTHVSFPGGHYVADGLYDEIMRDYRSWRKNGR